MLSKVLERFPSLYPYIYQSYCQPSILFYGQSKILSRRGVQQGDPLGPGLFCVSIEDIVFQMASELNEWYLDDGTVADTPEVVLQDFQTIISENATLGLEVNPSKCEIFVLGTDDKQIKESIHAAFNIIAPWIDMPKRTNAFL